MFLLENKYFSVAPMMGWTDRHCRYFYRLMSKQTILYTEMITADAIIHGDHRKFLNIHKDEHPVVLQLGGSDRNKLSLATKIANDYGFDEINLNVGCPSYRVQSGTFGACLMKNPDLVAELVYTMQSVSEIPITIKCRIGVDDDDPYEVLPNFIHKIHQSGCKKVIIHARKAWLKGLSPKENREIPPLDYNIVYQMKQMFPNLHIGINGGIENIDEAQNHLKYVDEVMMGRSVYHNPSLLLLIDQKIYNHTENSLSYYDILQRMVDYINQQKSLNINLYAVIRHMLGLFFGQPNARLWRRILTEEGVNSKATADILWKAYNVVLCGTQE